MITYVPETLNYSDGDMTIKGKAMLSNGVEFPIVATYYTYRSWEDAFPAYTEYITDNDGNVVRMEQTRGFRYDERRTAYVARHWEF